jgi:hypothetical protein
MPLGIQRLNVKKSQPNNDINFIKPLKGPDEAIAQDFLERIAAQCGESAVPTFAVQRLYLDKQHPSSTNATQYPS